MVFSVTAVATHMVQPASPAPSFSFPASVPPSNLDLIMPTAYVDTVCLYPSCPGSGGQDFFSCDILLPSLRQALSVFYPFAGTLTDDFTILCNGNGAFFVDARADCCSIAELDDFTSHDSCQLLQLLVPKADEWKDTNVRPLLLIQVTHFTCGGVAFGMALNHQAADGPSAFVFLKAWCSLARGEPLTSFPDFDRAWLRARSPPSPQFAHEEYLRLPQPRNASCKGQQNTPSDAADAIDNEVIVSVFELPQDFLQKWKLISAGKYSTYEMLAAHVWRCSCEARMLLPEVESMLVMVVDGRERLKGLSNNPKNHVGNVVLNCCLSLTVREILESSVVVVAAKIRAMLRKMDDAYCRSAIDFLETRTHAELASYVKGPHTCASPNLAFISWAKLPLYDIDFGWGKPTYAGRVSGGYEGRSTLLPSPHAGALRLWISLYRPHMQKFAELFLNF